MHFQILQLSDIYVFSRFVEHIIIVALGAEIVNQIWQSTDKIRNRHDSFPLWDNERRGLV